MTNGSVLGSFSLVPNTPTEEESAAIYSPESLQRLASVLWNSREEPRIQSVLLYVVLGAFAGLRPAEAVALQWKQVDWLKREIRLEAPTVKVVRSVPIRENLMTFFAPFKGRNGLVVVHKKVANLLRNECASAGVTHISNGLRRSYISYRLAESSEQIVQNEIGVEAFSSSPVKAVTATEAAKYWAVRP